VSRRSNHSQQQYIPAAHFGTFEKYRELCELFDSAWHIPGTRIRVGLDALIGLVPGAGDLISAAFAGYGIVLARRLGAPRTLQARMLWNVVLDTLGGSIPLVGDLFDVTFRAHQRNRKLLDKWLARTE
jgi:hypothetical protein